MRKNALLHCGDRVVGKLTFGSLRAHDAVRRLWSPRRRSTEIDDDAVRTIAAIKLCCLGDAILAVPSLRALKTAWPKARLVVVCTPRTVEVFRDLPFTDDVILLRLTGLSGALGMASQGLKSLSALYRVCRLRADIAVDLDVRYKISPVLAYLSGAAVRVGFDTEGCDRAGLYTASTPRELWKWEAECLLDIVALLGIPTDDKRVEFPIPEEVDAEVADLLRERGVGEGDAFVAMCPGASKNWPNRRWPAERYAEVARFAWQELGRKVVLVGAGFERELCAGIAEAGGPEVINLAGETSVPGTAAVLRRAEGFVTNDTGPMHVGFAVGTPMVAIFGPGNDPKWAPRGPRDIVVKDDNCDCRPCFLVGQMPDCQHIDCLQKLPTEPVIEALVQILDGEPSGIEAPPKVG